MKLPSLAIENYQFTIVVIVLLTLLGWVSFNNMPRSEDPTLSVPGVRVVVVFPGASPTDIESLIVDPIEEAINALEDVRELSSASLDGVGDIGVEFLPTVDPDDAYNDVNQAINQIRGDLPEGVLALEAYKFSTSDVTILQVALVSELADYALLEEHAEDLEKRFERVSGVKQADTWGYPDTEVRVSLDLQKMREVGLSIQQVSNAIQSNSQNIPGGSIDAGSRRFNIQTSGDYESLEDIRQTIVHSMGGRLVYLNDIADVGYNYEDETYRARFNGKRAVFVTVFQREGANIFQVMAGLDAELDSFSSGVSSGVTVETVFNQAISVDERINGFLSNLLQGMILVGVITFLALGGRAAGIVVVAIPVSILIAMGWVDLNGFGIEQMSIVGLVVALGLLVDNAIVVTENVARFKRLGKQGADAAIQGTSEVGWAVVAATITTVLSFLPIVLLDSDSGQYIRSMPVTVIFALAASLIVSLTLTPFLAGRLIRNRASANEKEGGFQNGWLQPLINRMVEGPYERTVSGAIKRPVLVLTLAIAAFAGSLMLFPLVGVSLFPKAEKPQFLLNIETPEGSSLQYTDDVTRRVEQKIREYPAVIQYASNIGRDNPRFYYNVLPRGERSNIAQMMIELDSYGSMRQALADLKEEFGAWPGVDIDLVELENGPPIEAPIAIKLIGSELDVLKQLAGEVEQIFREVEGTENINNPIGKPKTDLQVRINRDKAGLLGVPLVEIDRTVRTGLAGMPVATYRDEQGDEHQIVLRLPLKDRPTLADFDRISVASFTGASVPLRQVAELEMKAVPTRIDHFNLERTVTITSYAAEGYSDFELTDEILGRLDEVVLPEGYRYYVAGKLEAQEESFAGLASALVVAILGILGVLVLQFRSFLQPLIIIVAVPLAIIGSIPALLLTGYTFSFSAFIGLTSLVGIVVNNAIILVDYANQQIEKGMEPAMAILKSSKTRFSPIVITTLTTIGGLLPLTLSGSTMWSPMGWVIIGGLIASAVLTLLVVPVLYSLFTSRSVHEIDTLNIVDEA